MNYITIMSTIMCMPHLLSLQTHESCAFSVTTPPPPPLVNGVVTLLEHLILGMQYVSWELSVYYAWELHNMLAILCSWHGTMFISAFQQTMWLEPGNMCLGVCMLLSCKCKSSCASYYRQRVECSHCKAMHSLRTTLSSFEPCPSVCRPQKTEYGIFRFCGLPSMTALLKRTQELLQLRFEVYGNEERCKSFRTITNIY